MFGNGLDKIRNIKINWIWLCILACITGLYGGLINQVSTLANTSLLDIFISWEWWIFFGLLICLNQSSFIKSSIKCGFFFLINVNIMYLVMWYFDRTFSFDLWLREIIVAASFFVVGAILWYSNRKGTLGNVITALPLSILFIIGCSYIYSAIFSFPYHIASAILTIAQLVLWLLIICKDKKSISKTMIYIIVFTFVFVGIWLVLINVSSIWKTAIIF